MVWSRRDPGHANLTPPPSHQTHLLTQSLRATHSLPQCPVWSGGAERRDRGDIKCPRPSPLSDLQTHHTWKGSTTCVLSNTRSLSALYNADTGAKVFP